VRLTLGLEGETVNENIEIILLKEGVTSFGITGYCPSASGGKM
jgi:hypothetical protein